MKLATYKPSVLIPVSITITFGDDDFCGIKKTGPDTFIARMIFVLFFSVSVAVDSFWCSFDVSFSSMGRASRFTMNRCKFGKEINTKITYNESFSLTWSCTTSLYRNVQ